MRASCLGSYGTGLTTPQISAVSRSSGDRAWNAACGSGGSGCGKFNSTSVSRAEMMTVGPSGAVAGAHAVLPHGVRDRASLYLLATVAEQPDAAEHGLPGAAASAVPAVGAGALDTVLVDQ